MVVVGLNFFPSLFCTRTRVSETRKTRQVQCGKSNPTNELQTMWVTAGNQDKLGLPATFRDDDDPKREVSAQDVADLTCINLDKWVG